MLLVLDIIESLFYNLKVLSILIEAQDITLVRWVLKSDLGYYVVVDLQQNHLNHELCEEEVIKFETLRLTVLQIVINAKSKEVFPRDAGIKRCSAAPQAYIL